MRIVESTFTEMSKYNGSLKVYGVPRRFDLATLFAVSLAYAVLFGLMRILSFHPAAFAAVAGLVTAVGVAQALLFRGQAPRIASVLVGMIAASIPVIVTLVGYISGGLILFGLIECSILTLFCLPLGALCGYLSGGVVAGVFLVADLVRKKFGSSQQH